MAFPSLPSLTEKCLNAARIAVDRVDANAFGLHLSEICMNGVTCRLGDSFKRCRQLGDFEVAEYGNRVIQCGLMEGDTVILFTFLDKELTQILIFKIPPVRGCVSVP